MNRNANRMMVVLCVGLCGARAWAADLSIGGAAVTATGMSLDQLKQLPDAKKVEYTIRGQKHQPPA